MKIGLCFGGYCPMHIGHLDLIMRAKKENDRCIVAVCGHDNEKRADEIDLNLKDRYNIIKEFFADDDLISVVYIDDTVLGIDESMSISNWKIWIGDVYKKANINDNIDDVSFYIGEESYKDVLAALGKKFVYVDRTLNDVSATMIRKNPLKYWSKIAKPFKPYMTTNILVIGTASEGKTTLVKDIANYFDAPYTTEFGRDYIEQYHIKSDAELTKESFHMFLLGQLAYLCKAQKKSANGLVIADTDSLVTLMYAKRYSTDEGMKITPDDYKELYIIAKRLETPKWTKIFFIEPDSKSVNDGIRHVKQSTMIERNLNASNLKELVNDFIPDADVTYLKGGEYLNNFNIVKEEINKLLNS